MSSQSTSRENTTPESTTRVLAVEDNYETRLLLGHLFEGIYDVTVVSGVQEALEAAKQSSFDVFLLDIHLSEERTGVDLLHLLRERSKGEGAPAVALTAYAMPGDEKNFLEEGFDGYVSKPFTREEVTEAIGHVLGE